MEQSVITAPNYVSVKSINKANGTLSAIASTGSVDRDGEIIEPQAFGTHLESFRRNPVILSQHQHVSFNAEPTIIGSAKSVNIKDDQVEFEMEFASTSLAKTWRTLFEEGHAKAFSVGFIPKNGENRKKNSETVYVHTEVELLEISAVSVPSNRDALSRSKGFQDAIKTFLENHESELLEKIAGQLDDRIAELKEYLGTLIIPDDDGYYKRLADGDSPEISDAALAGLESLNNQLKGV